MADEVKELKKDTSELTTALRRLSDSTTSAARTFGEFGAATGKVGRAWTIMSRITSGSGFWQIQNRIRSVSNIFELFTKAQEASFDAQIKSLDAGEGLRDSLDAISKALAGPIQNTKRYKNLLLSLGDPQKAASIATDEYLGIHTKLVAQIKKQDSALRKKFGIDKSSLQLLKDRVKEEGVLAEITRPTKKFLSRVKGVGSGITDALLGKKGSGFKRDERGFVYDRSRLRRGFGEQMVKGGGNIVDKVGGFLKLGTLFFSKFLLLGAVASLVFGLLFLFLRKTIPTLMKFFADAFGNFKKAFSAIGKVVVGVFSFFKALFEGRIFDAIRILFMDIIKNLLIAVGNIIGGLIKIALGAIASAIAGLGRTLYSLLKRIPVIGGYFASGGVVRNGGMSVVGEQGPELVRLPVGSRVFSNAESKRMVGGTTNITVQVTGRVGASDMEIKDIAKKVSREIGLQMNRTGSTAVRF